MGIVVNIANTTVNRSSGTNWSSYWTTLPYFALPSTGVTLLVGNEVTIYGDALVNVPMRKQDNFTATFTCDIGSQTGNNYTINPVDGDIGDHSMTIVFKRGTYIFETKTITITVAAKAVARSLKILRIGDSTMGGETIGVALDAALPGFTITYLGTQGTTRKHEGYGGNRFYEFVTELPFFIGGVLDVPQYFIDNAIDVPDLVYIRLGLNDMSHYASHTDTPAWIDNMIQTTIFNRSDALIDAFLAYNADLRIIVAVCSTATSDYDKLTAPQQAAIDQVEKFIEIIHQFQLAVVTKYGAGVYDARVDCSYEWIHLDRDAGYLNYLHFDTTVGDPMMGQGLAPYINKYMTPGEEAIRTDGNTVAWFVADDVSTITKNAGTGKVSQWNDRLGSGRNLIQADANRQPIWATPGTITFDGLTTADGDFMQTADFTFNQPEFIYMLVKQKTWTATDFFFDGKTRNIGAVYQSATTPGLKALAGTASAQNDNLPVDTWGIIRMLFNGASSKLQIDDTAATTGNFGASNMGGFTLGCQGFYDIGNTYFSNIEVKEIILRSGTDATAEADIYNYLLSRKP